MPLSLARLIPALKLRRFGERTEPKPLIDAYPPEDEARLPLHVLADDARLSISQGQLMVETAEDKQMIRLNELSLIALHGGARVTIPCLHSLARVGIPVLLLSRRGYYLGQMLDLSGNASAVRRAQYRASEDPRLRLSCARDLVGAKLRAASRLARRRSDARDPLVRMLHQTARKVARSRSEAALRGLEGAGAAAWYAAWPEFLRRDEPLFAFDGRNRRPPRDAVNSLLSYLYAVTTGLAANAALGAGLDPAVGLFHAERPGRPALALDLVEPFRVGVVDTAVLAAINGGRFDAADFETVENGGVLLSQAGKKKALMVLEDRLSTRFLADGARISWRDAMTRTAVRLAASLRSGTAQVRPPLPIG